MIDINELRRLAQAATPGPWIAAGPSFGESLPKHLNEVVVDREGDEDDGYSICNAPIGLNEERSDDMAFIAEANPLAIEELLDRLEAAEKSRDDLLACLGEWLDKTKWVQQGSNEGTISAKYLGLHRADVMSSLLGEAEKERDALRNEIACVKEVEFPRKAQAVADAWKGKCERLEAERDALRAELAQLHKEADQFGDGIDWIQRALQAEAKIEEMERQEPAGYGVRYVEPATGEEDWDSIWIHRVFAEDHIKDFTQAYVDMGEPVGALTVVPLYALPGAQAQNVPKAVAYLDLGTGGYMDIGTDLPDEALAALPKGRHMLGVIGTYGVDGYVPAQPAPSVPETKP